MIRLRDLGLAAVLLVAPLRASAVELGASSDGVSNSSAAATYVNKAGDTMTGPLAINHGALGTVDSVKVYASTNVAATYIEALSAVVEEGANGVAPSIGLRTYNGGGYGGSIRGTVSSGTALTPLATGSGQHVQFDLTGFGTAYTGSKARVKLATSEDWTGSAQGARIELFTTATGATSIAERARIDESGLGVYGSITASSLTTSGDFSIAGGTATTSGGIFDVPSQPSITVSSPTNNAIVAGSFAPIFWVNVDTQTTMGFDAVNSSDTVTVPVAGAYLTICKAYTNDATTSLSVRLRVSGVTQDQVDIDPISGSNSSATSIKILQLPAGSGVSCDVTNTGAGFLSTSRQHTYFQVRKL